MNTLTVNNLNCSNSDPLPQSVKVRAQAMFYQSSKQVFAYDLLLSRHEHHFQQQLQQLINHHHHVFQHLTPIMINIPSSSFMGQQLESCLPALRQLMLKQQKPVYLAFHEALLQDDHAYSCRLLSALQTKGFKVIISGIGKTELNIDFLNHHLVNALSFDTDLLNLLNHNKQIRFIVSSIIRIAQHYNISTIAPNIEQASIYQLLKAWQCDILHGNYLQPAIDISCLPR